MLNKIKLFFSTKKQLQPVFIVGVPRSGTTWLWGLLTSHPKVVALERTHFDSTRPAIVDGKRMTSETGAFINFKDKHILQVVKDVSTKNSEKVIIEKTPTHIKCLDRIFRLFPNAKIIHVKREPKAVIASMLNSHFFNFAENVKDAVNYRNTLLNQIKPYEYDKRVITVKYENLVDDAKSEMAKLFPFICLPTEEYLIEEIVNQNSGRTKVDLEGVFRKGKKDSYLEDLSEAEIAYIDANTSY